LKTIQWRVVSAVLIGALSFVPPTDPARQAPSSIDHLTYRQIVCRQYSLHDPAIPLVVLRREGMIATAEVEGNNGTRWSARAQGLAEIAPSGKVKVWTPKDGLPIVPLTSVAVGPAGWVWMGTPDGAISFHPGAPRDERWFYFWGRRYLSDNTVVNIVAGPCQAWIETRTGISRIQFKTFTLEEKSALFIRRLHQYNDRYGLIADAPLPRPGQLSSAKPISNDNDGLWTSLYVSSECFRYATTHSPGALQNAENSLQGLFRLLWITGIPGFPARSFVHRREGGDTSGQWHWTPGGHWRWKGDTSSDELVGHFFAYSIAYDELPQQAEFYREAIRNAAVSIANNLMEHGWNLTGYHGRITKWGRYSQAYFKTPSGREDAGLNSLELLSHLLVAYHVSGNLRFLEAYHQLVDRGGYLRNITTGFSHLPPPEDYNYSDEELAFLSFYPLLKYEREPQLRPQIQAALAGLWRHAKAEHNPLWDYIYEVGTDAKNYDAEGALNALERIPSDTIYWTVHNSQRLDLPFSLSLNRFESRQSLTVIPPDERCTSKWNGDPFALNCDSGGRSEDDGTFFLLPYWFGRHYKLLPP
jgi:hypothetical protein